MRSTEHIPAECMDALVEFYEGVDVIGDTFAVMEVMRMIGRDEMMKEADGDAVRFYEVLYYLILVLKAKAKFDKE